MDSCFRRNDQKWINNPPILHFFQCLQLIVCPLSQPAFSPLIMLQISVALLLTHARKPQIKLLDILVVL